MPRPGLEETNHDRRSAPIPGGSLRLPFGLSAVARSGPRHVSRRMFLSLALSGLLLTACKREQIVYIDPPTLPASGQAVPTPATAPASAQPTPQPQPTAAPKPDAKPVVPTPNLGPIQLPIAVPAGAMAAQSQVIPAIQPRTRPYANRLQPAERLQIPSIDLDAKVILVGTKTDQQGHLLWETAAFAVGHHKGSAMPGENGNVVLSGHISSPREGAVFNKLPKVEPGDGVVVSTADRQYLYVVTETHVVTPDAVEVLDPTDHAILTMLTCVPDGVYSHRLVVRAEAV